MDFDQLRGDVAITYEIDLWEGGEIRYIFLPSTLRTIARTFSALGEELK